MLLNLVILIYFVLFVVLFLYWRLVSYIEKLEKLNGDDRQSVSS